MVVKNRIMNNALIMPAVYDDALTYMEQIKILDSKLTEVINLFNELEYSAVEQSAEYTDKRIEEVRTEVNAAFESYKQQISADFKNLETSLQHEIATAVRSMREELERLFDRVNNLVSDVQNRLDQLQISVNTLFDALNRSKLEMRQDMEKGFQNIMSYVDSAIVAKYGTGIIVFNPLQKRNTDLNTALHDLYHLVARIWSLTVNEYKSLGQTVEKYKGLEITVNEYLYHGKLIFFRKLYFQNYEEDFQKVYDYINADIEAVNDNFYMTSPFNGKKELISKVVNDLADLHKDGITVDEYKTADLTLDEYAEKHIGAHDYAWNGYYLINTDAIPKETLEEQIKELQRVVAGISASGVNQSEFIPYKESTIENTADITILKNAVNAHAETLTTLDSRMTAAELGIKANADSLTTLDSKISAAELATKSVTDGLEKIHIKY